MAAGAGFKTFNTGDVLSAADVNTYLMQGVWVFANAAARDAAVTSPQEGNFAYLKDTNVTTYYTGSAWANLDTTGMTNPMTTTGDTIYSSSGSTPARLGIGSTGQVLTVAGGLPSWATPSSGAWTLINAGGTALSGATTTVSSIPATYSELVVVVNDFYPSSVATPNLYFNTDSTSSNYSRVGVRWFGTTNEINGGADNTIVYLSVPTSQKENSLTVRIVDYANTTSHKNYLANAAANDNSSASSNGVTISSHRWMSTSAINAINFQTAAGTWSGGTMYVYGVK